MRSQKEKQAVQEKNDLKKLLFKELVDELKKRLQNSKAIQKANKDDEKIDLYQSGRRAELEYCINLLVPPRRK